MTIPSSSIGWIFLSRLEVGTSEATMKWHVTALCHENEANGTPKDIGRTTDQGQQAQSTSDVSFGAYVLNLLAATSPPHIQVL